MCIRDSSRLRAEEGDRGAQQTEALLRELTGQTLEEWLRRSFFNRHVRQFKHRPIAWHLASTPTKDGGRKTKAKREPAFECLLYYHACRGDVLARLRAHYVEPLIRLQTATAADARDSGDETQAAIPAAPGPGAEKASGGMAGDMLDSVGTAEAVLLTIERPLQGKGVAEQGYEQGAQVAGGYYGMGAYRTSGVWVEWFRTNLAGGADYATLTAEAEAAPVGSLGVRLSLIHI